MLVPERPNERWSLDFVSDAFTDGRRFRVLAIVDDFSRECLALVALAIVLGPMADKGSPSLSGLRVTRDLTAIMARRGRPKTIVSDNGTELTSMAGLRWCQETQIDWHYIAPGKPPFGTLLCNALPGNGCRTHSWRASTAASATSL